MVTACASSTSSPYPLSSKVSSSSQRPFTSSHSSTREFFCHSKQFTGALLRHKALGASQTLQMWNRDKEALQMSCLTANKDEITERTRTSQQSCPCQWSQVLLWAKLSEIKRLCSHFGAPGHPWLSWILSVSPIFSFPGWKVQLHLGIPLLRFRKSAVTVLVHIVLCECLERESASQMYSTTWQQ